MTGFEDLHKTVDAQIEGADTAHRYLRTTDSPSIAMIAERLAVDVGDREIDALLAWDRADDAVVTHALALALGGLPVVRAELDLGLWSTEGVWPSASARFGLVSADWRGGTAAPLAALCTARGHSVQAVVSVLSDRSAAADQVAQEHDAALICADLA